MRLKHYANMTPADNQRLKNVTPSAPRHLAVMFGGHTGTMMPRTALAFLLLFFLLLPAQSWSQGEAEKPTASGDGEKMEESRGRGGKGGAGGGKGGRRRDMSEEEKSAPDSDPPKPLTPDSGRPTPSPATNGLPTGVIDVEITEISRGRITFLSQAPAGEDAEGETAMRRGRGRGRSTDGEATTHDLASNVSLTSATIARRTQAIMQGEDLAGGFGHPAFADLEEGGRVRARITFDTRTEEVTAIQVIVGESSMEETIAIRPKRPPVISK